MRRPLARACLVHALQPTTLPLLRCACVCMCASGVCACGCVRVGCALACRRAPHLPTTVRWGLLFRQCGSSPCGAAACTCQLERSMRRSIACMYMPVRPASWRQPASQSASQPARLPACLPAASLPACPLAWGGAPGQAVGSWWGPAGTYGQCFGQTSQLTWPPPKLGDGQSCFHCKILWQQNVDRKRF